MLLEKYAQWRVKKAIKLKLQEAEAKNKDLANQSPSLVIQDNLPDIENQSNAQQNQTIIKNATNQKDPHLRNQTAANQPELINPNTRNETVMRNTTVSQPAIIQNNFLHQERLAMSQTIIATDQSSVEDSVLQIEEDHSYDQIIETNINLCGVQQHPQAKADIALSELSKMMRQQDYFEEIFPELAMENLTQGMTHQVRSLETSYTLLYLMPENNIWKDKAMVTYVLNPPKFVKNNPEGWRKFILNECKFHWLDPQSADKLANKFNKMMLKKDKVKDDLASKQVIWIVEAAKQRYIETVWKELIELDKVAAEVQIQRTEERRKREESLCMLIMCHQIESNDKSKVPEIDIPQSKLTKLFAKECLYMKFSKKESKNLITYWYNNVKPGLIVSNKDEQIIACILIKIKENHAIERERDKNEAEFRRMQAVCIKEDKNHAAKVDEVKRKLAFIN